MRWQVEDDGTVRPVDAPPPVPPCGQATVLLHPDPYDNAYSGPCVLPTGHGPHHRDTHDNTWTESVR